MSLEEMADIKRSANGKRYVALSGSQSSHCCFTYTVLDTHSEEHINSYHGFFPMCECFEKEAADTIVDALNKL